MLQYGDARVFSGKPVEKQSAAALEKAQFMVPEVPEKKPVPLPEYVAAMAPVAKLAPVQVAVPAVLPVPIFTKEADQVLFKPVLPAVSKVEYVAPPAPVQVFSPALFVPAPAAIAATPAKASKGTAPKAIPLVWEKPAPIATRVRVPTTMLMARPPPPPSAIVIPTQPKVDPIVAQSVEKPAPIIATPVTQKKDPAGFNPALFSPETSKAPTTKPINQAAVNAAAIAVTNAVNSGTVAVQKAPAAASQPAPSRAPSSGGGDDGGIVDPQQQVAPAAGGGAGMLLLGGGLLLLLIRKKKR